MVILEIVEMQRPQLGHGNAKCSRIPVYTFTKKKGKSCNRQNIASETVRVHCKTKWFEYTMRISLIIRSVETSYNVRRVQ